MPVCPSNIDHKSVMMQNTLTLAAISETFVEY
jgi:hypothetical protein